MEKRASQKLRFYALSFTPSSVLRSICTEKHTDTYVYLDFPIPLHRVTGSWPFDEQDATTLNRRIRSTPVSFSDPVWSVVSPDLCDLVRALLRPNKAERPTAAAALRHPWAQADVMLLSRQALQPQRPLSDSISALYRVEHPLGLPIGRLAVLCPAALTAMGTGLSITVRFDAPVRAPAILSHLSAAVVREGDSARLECRLTAHPKPHLTWFFNDVDLKALDNRRYATEWDENSGTATLIIQEAAVYDSGTYSFTADNGFGTVTDSATVSVQRHRDFGSRAEVQSVDSLAAKVELPPLDQEIRLRSSLEISVRGKRVLYF